VLSGLLNALKNRAVSRFVYIQNPNNGSFAAGIYYFDFKTTNENRQVAVPLFWAMVINVYPNNEINNWVVAPYTLCRVRHF
jgi:hypothetical protein